MDRAIKSYQNETYLLVITFAVSPNSGLTSFPRRFPGNRVGLLGLRRTSLTCDRLTS